jgi:hypothetical protein
MYQRKNRQPSDCKLVFKRSCPGLLKRVATHERTSKCETSSSAKERLRVILSFPALSLSLELVPLYEVSSLAVGCENESERTRSLSPPTKSEMDFVTSNYTSFGSKADLIRDELSNVDWTQLSTLEQLWYGLFPSISSAVHSPCLLQ